MTDTERLDWLENQQGSALLSDDNGHWAVSSTGMRNINTVNENPIDIQSAFFTEKTEWRNSIREAIDAAMREDAEW